MSGKAKKMLDFIIMTRAKGDQTIAMTTKTKLVLKGFNPDAYTPQSADDPATIDKIRTVGRELGIDLSNF